MNRGLPRRTAGRVGRARAIIRGLFLLGTGRAAGFACFEDGREPFLSALTPPLAFLVVLAALLLAQRPSLAALCLLLLILCAILLPPVISHLMAGLWKRGDRWQRYATASAWSVWLILPAYLPAMLLASILLAAGVGQAQAGRAAMLLLGGYFLWLQWFMAWKGLRIGWFKAVLTVLALTVGSSLIAAALQPLVPLLVPERSLDGSMVTG